MPHRANWLCLYEGPTNGGIPPAWIGFARLFVCTPCPDWLRLALVPATGGIARHLTMVFPARRGKLASFVQNRLRTDWLCRRRMPIGFVCRQLRRRGADGIGILEYWDISTPAGRLARLTNSPPPMVLYSCPPKLASFGDFPLTQRWPRLQLPHRLGLFVNRPGLEYCNDGTRRRPPATGSKDAPRPFASHFSCFSMLPPHLVSNPTPNQRRPAATSQSQARRRPSRQWPTHRQGSVHNIINQRMAHVNCKEKIIDRLDISTNPCPTRTKRPLQRNVAQPPPAVESQPAAEAADDREWKPNEAGWRTPDY